MDKKLDTSEFSLKILTSINELALEDWDKLNPTGHPFVTHGFLSALEESKCVGKNTGWDISHFCIYDEKKRLRAAIPHYLKYHSYGEYIFDQSWANAYERAGKNYYPKSLGAIPFTPVPGPRLLSSESDTDAKQALLSYIEKIVERNNLSSAHINFINLSDLAVTRKMGWMIREGLQFHWHNQGYNKFDDFLDKLTSRKRKNIRKERESIQKSTLNFVHLVGEDIKVKHWDIFYECYLATIEKKWGGAYLTRNFFHCLSKKLKNEILLILCFDQDTPVAGALNLIGSNTLYGRNWGSLRNIPFLHFETCYYQAIEFAIQNGIKRVEAGAQGLHKVSRGYLPQKTYSAHKIVNPQFEEAIKQFLSQELLQNEKEALLISKTSPYR